MRLSIACSSTQSTLTMGVHMRMRHIASGAVCIGAALALSSPVLAGERTGQGKPTPIESYSARASICAFSGLEDFNFEEPVQPGVTQTPAFEGGERVPPGSARICSVLNNGNRFYD